MKMLQAIAESAGNKARARNDDGMVVIVQGRYTTHKVWWYHVWLINEVGEIDEADITKKEFPRSQRLKELFSVDPSANYWHAV